MNRAGLRLSRRRFIQAGVTGAAILSSPALLAGVSARIVIIGGGPGGVLTARKLAALDGSLKITLIEANPEYMTPFIANQTLVGMQKISTLTFNYDRVEATQNIDVIFARATSIDAVKRRVRLKSGKKLDYDRLVVAPGIDFVPGSIENYDGAVMEKFPHAYLTDGPKQWQNLARRLDAMENGATFAVSVPKHPYRCTPAPYARATLIANYLKQNKPNSKIQIFDGNDAFPFMDLMIPLWEDSFGENVEWVPADFGGTVTRVDAASGTIIAGDEEFTPDVANIIPPQRAGKIAVDAGLVDDTGWCPVAPDSMQSLEHSDIHVLGDAADGGDMPKSAASAASQAEAVALSVFNAVSGKNIKMDDYQAACYFLLKDREALVSGGRYQPKSGRIVGIEGYASAVGDGVKDRSITAKQAEIWYKTIVRTMFS